MSNLLSKLRSDFSNTVSAKPKRKPPVLIRFSKEEIDQLREWANGRPLGSVVRERLFGKNAKKGRKTQPPPRQQKAIANALRRLGHSGIATALMCQIVAAEEGRVLLTKQEQAALREAYAECYAIRKDLIIALGIEADGVAL